MQFERALRLELMRDLSLSCASLLPSPGVGGDPARACDGDAPLSAPRCAHTRPFSLPARSTRLSFARVVTTAETNVSPPPLLTLVLASRTISRSLHVLLPSSPTSALLLSSSLSSSTRWCCRLPWSVATGVLSKVAPVLSPPLERCEEAAAVSPVVQEMVNWTMVWLRLLCVFIYV